MRWVVDVDGLVGSLREVLMLFKCMAADDGGLDGGLDGGMGPVRRG